MENSADLVVPWLGLLCMVFETGCATPLIMIGNTAVHNIYAQFIYQQLGLERFHGVGIIGFNSPEWLISDLGAIFAG